jgi:DNA (cytosine-5)-methyltransferase 1
MAQLTRNIVRPMQRFSYYNEIDSYAAAWLRNLIAAGHIAHGVVDTRSIVDVRAEDIREFAQCHFFAGIGGWSLAARLAGWPDDLPLWTGSCPCQPFSAAGKGAGFDDARHLWPTWFDLIRECRPGVVFGEQVASKDGLMWLDLVHSDMESAGYAFAALDMCSAGFGAPHIRQRLGFVADTDQGQRGRVADGQGRERDGSPAGWQQGDGVAERGRAVGGVGHAESQGLHEQCGTTGSASAAGRSIDAEQFAERSGNALECDRPGPTNGPWGAADWLLCRDGKWRPVEPGTFPLAHGISGRVGRLRAYGNAINPHQFKALISAYMDCRP